MTHKHIEVDLSAFEKVFNHIDQGLTPLFITGKAGTGKTTLIKEIYKKYGSNQVVLAPTGIAALQAEGQTIHSFFALSPGLEDLREIKPIRNSEKIILIKKLDRIIIDEISMVRADLLDKIDHVLKMTRGNNELFGGVQVIMIGDFFQLPPITLKHEISILENAGYKSNSHFAFDAKCLKSSKIFNVELNKVFRQSDLNFIKLLNAIRKGEDLDWAVFQLNKHCFKLHNAEKVPVLLTGTNAIANEYNSRKLAELKDNSFSFRAIESGDLRLKEDQLPAPHLLELKVGARVIMVKNDSDDHWVNGSLGTICYCNSKGDIQVRLDEDNKVYSVNKMSWERYSYEWSSLENKIVKKIVGTYQQIPMKLAWALTVHKAQGLTLEDVRIDINQAFASGQLYVALSRVKNIDGLSFVQPIIHSNIIVDKIIKEIVTF